MITKAPAEEWRSQVDSLARVIPLGRYPRPASQYKLPFRAPSEGEDFNDDDRCD